MTFDEKLAFVRKHFIGKQIKITDRFSETSITTYRGFNVANGGIDVLSTGPGRWGMPLDRVTPTLVSGDVNATMFQEGTQIDDRSSVLASIRSNTSSLNKSLLLRSS